MEIAIENEKNTPRLLLFLTPPFIASFVLFRNLTGSRRFFPLPLLLILLDGVVSGILIYFFVLFRAVVLDGAALEENVDLFPNEGPAAVQIDGELFLEATADGASGGGFQVGGPDEFVEATHQHRIGDHWVFLSSLLKVEIAAIVCVYCVVCSV
ncbi:hypothetical protein CASFOL_036096 [Castilleja foliolosa]|uniref:Uncharacterized protein n=1 Tax=Castilleja foliolosa TaxID=1961234 RepID=A0ABD3BVE6_9LAMI